MFISSKRQPHIIIVDQRTNQRDAAALH